MRKLFSDLMSWNDDCSYFKIASLSAQVLKYKFIYGCFVLVIIVLLENTLYVAPPPKIKGDWEIFSIEFLPMLFIFAGAEEILFRFLPASTTMLALYWLSNLLSQKTSDQILLGVMTISSVLFGWMHGGIANIFIQGVSGLLVSLLFIRIAKVQDVFVALWCTTIVHFLFNGILVLLLVLGGETKF